MELLVVVSVIGIIAGIALPRVNFAQYRANAAGGLVRGTLQQAQRLAIVRQFDVVVALDPAAGRLRVLGDANNDGAVGTGERVSTRMLEEGARFAVPPAGLSGTPAPAVAGGNLRPLDGLESITFHRNGSASSDLEVYVAMPAGRGPVEARAVRVLQATGRAELFRYNVLKRTWFEGGL